MSAIVLQVRGWRPRWHTSLVMASVLLVLVSFGLYSTALVPLGFTTATALAGGTGFALGVSASISAFLEREAYADSDFWR